MFARKAFVLTPPRSLNYNTHVLKEVVNTAMDCFTVNYETLLLSKIFHVCVTAVNSGTAATSFS